MKKAVVISLFIATLGIVACNNAKKSVLSTELDKYQVVKIAAPDLSDISDNGKECLNLYKFAAMQADEIYKKQAFSDPAALEKIADPAAKAYAEVNYGPWDRRTGRPFVDGYGMMPAGSNFYPADMTEEEFGALSDPAKYSPYTMITRSEDGSLKVEWFHNYFAEEIDKICNYLRAAADITIKPSVRAYLLAKIDALRSDDYYRSELAWLEMEDSKMDLVLGPDETNDDELYGIKKSYEAFVLLKDVQRTEELMKFTTRMEEFQQMLPCPEEFKAFVPGGHSDIFACDALYYGGKANAGIKVIAINLPFDERVQRERGTRTILMENIINAKFNEIIAPVGNVIIDIDQRAHVDADAFFWNIAFREVAHGLGVKSTLSGKPVAEALGSSAQTIEEAKSDILGVYLALQLINRHELNTTLSKEDALTTALTSFVRSGRFGNAEALGRANIICYNYLAANSSFNRNPNGHYTIDYANAEKAVASLAGELLKIQAQGDRTAAADFIRKYSSIGKDLEADFINIRLEKIPVDIRFEYEW